MRKKMMNLQEVKDAAVELKGKMSAYDFKPNTYVHVRTDDCFEANIPSAFILKHGSWYIIFAKHHDPLVFCESDVEQIYQYEITQSQIEELDKFKPKPKQPRATP